MLDFIHLLTEMHRILDEVFLPNVIPECHQVSKLFIGNIETEEHVEWYHHKYTLRKT